MENWKKNLNLFTNGKFKLYRHGELEKWAVHNGLILYWCHSCGSQGEWVYTSIEGCELGARKVEDMTYQELKGVPSHENWPATTDSMRNSLNQDIYHKKITALDFNYLLSIGVYPFDREDFKGGDVVPMTKD